MPSSNRYRQLFGNDGFRDLWAASFFARVAETIGMVAMPLFVYDLTGSATMMSVIFIVLTLPRVVLSPFSGVVADRFDRRRVMIVASLLRATSAAILPFCSAAWQVGFVALFLSVGSSLLMPAELAALPTLVPKEDLVTALSAIQVTGAVVRIAVPAIGALLIAYSGPQAAFWMQAAAILVGIYWLSRLRLPPQESPGSVQSVRRDIRDGFSTVWQTPMVRAICGTEALWTLAFAAISLSGVVYLEETLDPGNHSEVMYGALLGTMSLGAVLGALLARRIETRLGRFRQLTIGYLGPLALAPVYLEPQLPVLFVCWFVLGFTDALAVIAMHAYLAQSVADEMRGRVYAIWGGVIAAASLFAYAFAGWFTEQLGPAEAIAFSGLLVGLGGPAIALMHRPSEPLVPMPVDVPIAESSGQLQ